MKWLVGGGGGGNEYRYAWNSTRRRKCKNISKCDQGSVKLERDSGKQQ